MITCMEPISLPEVVREAGFIHQVKWDGVRGVAEIRDGGIRIFHKSGREATHRYPELGILPKCVKATHAVLDGEIVAFVDGKPSFYHVLQRSLSETTASTAHPVRYIVFDLLYVNRSDIRPLPLKERQRLLADCFTDSPVAAKTESFQDGKALYALMKEKNMEGIVSKRLNSRYTAGKNHSDWFKTKFVKKLLCAVTGVNIKNGLPSSLSLGLYRDGTLKPAGDVGSGLRREDLIQLAREMKPGAAPRIACWVRFAEWTPGGTLRHPVFLGFSDSAPETATGEEISL